MRFLLLLILGIFILASCSPVRIVNARAYKTSNKVEKRESKRHVANSESQKSKHQRYKLATSKNTQKQEDLESTVSSSLDKNYSSTFIEDKTVKINKLNKDANVELSTTQTSIKKNKKPISSDPTDEDIRVWDPISIISPAFAFLGALSILLSVIYLNVGLAFPVLLSLGILFFITAFILGLIAILRKKRNPKKYKGVVFAIIGFSVGILVSAILLIGISLYFLMYFL